MNPQQFRTRLINICTEIAAGDYGKAKAVFDLVPGMRADNPDAILLEALAMMLMRIEAREFEKTRLLARLSEAQSVLTRHKAELDRENRNLRAQLKGAPPLTPPIAIASASAALMYQAQLAATNRANLLLTGETGSGKGFYARHIHALGERSDKPFVAINCASIPSTLLESELFGIESGVASGVMARMGRFEQASGGTIFLDEIGDMSLECQPKILHVIETGHVEKVGGRRRMPVDVRIVAATHRDLEKCVDKGEFRADLFYRLNVLRIHMPALRERKEDIPHLAELFLSRVIEQSPVAASMFSREALDALANYAWPGNIRELENVTERAAFLAKNDIIMPEDLSIHPASPFYHGAPEQEPAETETRQDTAAPDIASFSLEAAEREHIRKVLALSGGNKSKAARLLKISREGLRLKLRAMAAKTGRT